MGVSDDLKIVSGEVMPADPLRERLRTKLKALISDLRGLQTHNEGEVRWDGDRFCAGRAEAYQDCADQLAALLAETPISVTTAAEIYVRGERIQKGEL